MCLQLEGQSRREARQGVERVGIGGEAAEGEHNNRAGLVDQQAQEVGCERVAEGRGIAHQGVIDQIVGVRGGGEVRPGVVHRAGQQEAPLQLHTRPGGRPRTADLRGAGGR